MKKISIALLSAMFATSAMAAHNSTSTVLGVPMPNVDSIVDSVLGKDPPQGNCYSGYHVKVIKNYNAKGKYIGKEVTCEED